MKKARGRLAERRGARPPAAGPKPDWLRRFEKMVKPVRYVVAPKSDEQKRQHFPVISRVQDGRLMLTPPDDPTSRAWVVGLDSADLHRKVIHFLRDRDVPVGDVIARMNSAQPPAGGSQAVRLDDALNLLEHLTISHAPLDPAAYAVRGEQFRYGRLAVRRTTAADLQETLRQLRDIAKAAIDDFRRRWVASCFESLASDETLLTEYRYLCDELRWLAPRDDLRAVLTNRIPTAGGCLTLGSSWSCELSRGWKRRCEKAQSASDWAECLLAIKHATNTRRIKERLACAHQEEKISAAWQSYGAWLSRRADAQKELEEILGLRVVLDGETIRPREKE